MKYANRIDYTDVHPFEVVKVISEKTLEIRRMDAKLDPNWKPEIHPGGFVGNCSNQNDQKYTYSSVEDAPTIRIRKHSNGKWYDKNKSRYSLADAPRKFHDYNF